MTWGLRWVLWTDQLGNRWHIVLSLWFVVTKNNVENIAFWGKWFSPKRMNESGWYRQCQTDNHRAYMFFEMSASLDVRNLQFAGCHQKEGPWHPTWTPPSTGSSHPLLHKQWPIRAAECNGGGGILERHLLEHLWGESWPFWCWYARCSSTIWCCHILRLSSRPRFMPLSVYFCLNEPIIIYKVHKNLLTASHLQTWTLSRSIICVVSGSHMHKPVMINRSCLAHKPWTELPEQSPHSKSALHEPRSVPCNQLQQPRIKQNDLFPILNTKWRGLFAELIKPPRKSTQNTAQRTPKLWNSVKDQNCYTQSCFIDWSNTCCWVPEIFDIIYNIIYNIYNIIYIIYQ